MEVELPQYYRQTFFSSDTLFYTERPVSHYGVEGEPVPYTLRGDNIISLLLLGSFILIIISVSKSRFFILRQLKDIFYPSHNDSNITETWNELRFQFFLTGLLCILMAIITYQYVNHFANFAFVFENKLLFIGIFLGIFVGYLLAKGLIYAVVNYVFFDSTQNSYWLKTLLFINAAMSVLLFPVVLLTTYINMSLENAFYFFGFIFIFSKSITIYKCWSIFFRKNDHFLQNILYFCALEIVPVLCLASGILVLIDNLKLNF